MPKISVVLVTARDDHPYRDIPGTHLFFPTFNSLLKQSFQDFELIVIDGLYEQRPTSLNMRTHVEVPSGRKIKYVRPKPSPYLEAGLWSVGAFFNTGLVHAEGELVQIIPDSVEFGDDYLERVWRWHELGFYPMTLTHYYRGPTVSVRDSREGQMMENEVKTKVPWEWTYGLIALPLERFLDVNGYDEAFDGKKSLEDCDLGLRLHNLEGRSKFVLDKGLYALEHDHGSVDPRVVRRDGTVACCNWAIVKLHERDRWTRVNDRKYTQEELSFISDLSTKWPCSNISGKEYDFSEGVGGFGWWASNVPVFNLRDMRNERQGRP